MNVQEILRKHEEHLMSLANVTGVGIGERKGKPVIKVFVTRKLPKSDLRPEDIVPKILDGCETDTEEIGVVSAEGPSKT